MKLANWNYLCVTDEPAVARPGGRSARYRETDFEPTRRSRFPKILAHHLLIDYDISIRIDSIWIDANIGIAGDLAAFAKNY